MPEPQLCIPLKDTAEMLICADKGLEYARILGWHPDLILGDFDSVPPEVLAFYQAGDCPVKVYPRMKDYTDTHLAVEAALVHGATEIILLGATGTRLDHTFANFQLLWRIACAGAVGRIIDNNHEITVIKDKYTVAGQPGDLVSLLPLTERVTGVTLTGFVYPLNDAVLENTNPIGISNELIATTATVSISDGALLMIKPREP